MGVAATAAAAVSLGLGAREGFFWNIESVLRVSLFTSAAFSNVTPLYPTTLSWIARTARQIFTGRREEVIA